MQNTIELIEVLIKFRDQYSKYLEDIALDKICHNQPPKLYIIKNKENTIIEISTNINITEDCSIIKEIDKPIYELEEIKDLLDMLCD